MIVARQVNDELHVLDRLRERVALAEGLGDDHRLDSDAQRRALQCLRRFGQRLADMGPDQVRAVGTNTFRQARNARRFIERAEKALGHRIEVIGGREEARLVYLGVDSALPDGPGRRLVVDVGGGSTEVVLGERRVPQEMDSLYMGCVSWSKRFFEDGIVREARWRKAVLAARVELEPIEARTRALGWDRCLGSSGTVLAVHGALKAYGWDDRGIGVRGLRRLAAELVDVRRAGRLDGVSEERLPVFAGGLAILVAVFEALGIERMEPSTVALREGLLHDMLGRARRVDVRDDTIRRLMERHHVDREQAGRVERTAQVILEAVAQPWKLDPVEARRLVGWAARLHEIGLTVGYAGYHKHGAYVVAHSDMSGFSREDQEMLAALVLGHRGRLDRKRLEDLGLSHERADDALRMCVPLRLATRLNRSRSQRPLPAFLCTVRDETVRLQFRRGWATRNPLTVADLEEEAASLRAAGFRLSVR